MRNSLAGELPTHIYCLVDTQFTHKKPLGYTPAVWFGLVSHPWRMWGCNVLLECGAIYRNLPPHALAFNPKPAPWKPHEAQVWNCYGWDFSIVTYNYLQGCGVLANTGKAHHAGHYLFTAIPIADGFSEEPEQAKEFSFIKLTNGRLTVQPTDRLLFSDPSFNKIDLFPKDLKRQTEKWSVE